MNHETRLAARQHADEVRESCGMKTLARGAWSVAVKTIASWECEGPGPHGGIIEAHHVNEDSEDNRLANGVSLCRACHMREHGLEYWEDKWDADVLEDLYVRRGWSGPDIAEYSGRSLGAVYAGLKQHGIPTRTR